ncbi:MAG: hypothetical protein WEF50_07620 [Myxococcota bacterium]
MALLASDAHDPGARSAAKRGPKHAHRDHDRSLASEGRRHHQSPAQHHPVFARGGPRAAGVRAGGIGSDARLGIEKDGALLVRPDQHVAWRSARGVASPSDALRSALGRCLWT